jgi:hypothetical protein
MKRLEQAVMLSPTSVAGYRMMDQEHNKKSNYKINGNNRYQCDKTYFQEK